MKALKFLGNWKCEQNQKKEYILSETEAERDSKILILAMHDSCLQPV